MKSNISKYSVNIKPIFFSNRLDARCSAVLFAHFLDSMGYSTVTTMDCTPMVAVCEPYTKHAFHSVEYSADKEFTGFNRACFCYPSDQWNKL